MKIDLESINIEVLHQNLIEVVQELDKEIANIHQNMENSAVSAAEKRAKRDNYQALLSQIREKLDAERA